MFEFAKSIFVFPYVDFLLDRTPLYASFVMLQVK
jgi:hypothetical protein